MNGNKYKKVVSVSLGSSKRNHEANIVINGKHIEIIRLGTDGNLDKAKEIFEKLDGKVDAFGLGGTDIGLMIANKWFPLHSVLGIIKNVKKTPIVDGTGLKTLLEKNVASILLQHIKENNPLINKKVLIMSGCDRWGLQKSFLNEGFTNNYGDLIFGLNIPILLKSERQVKNFASILLPIVSRLPFRWLYPLGDKQFSNTPRAAKLFSTASIIAGDRHYIMKYMPPRLDGKIIVTNTTTPDDMELFAKAGVHSVLTTTPILNGRSFGTNVMEAALIAASEYNETINYRKPTNYFNFLESYLATTEVKPQFTLMK